ncbi:hydroxysqualene dehydroxylase HpnE [Terriglobus albidus]|uniref:hydroxysqualene dehydroxylase HpnE n=1 Tax=Terriglobus albidus TaxID=1592106 RepID=UPI0021DFEE57|nr:hydroxysqualene dehydroxylase HpnE [Terriglobus albidus]
MKDVIIVGGGLAGLTAAHALAKQGIAVQVLERRPYIGGRAYSYEHPALNEVIDCQHVMLGCCTNLVALCKAAGLGDRIRWYDDLTFLEPGGRASRIGPSGLPAPGHNTLSFLKAPMLSFADKAAIVRGLLQFFRGYPKDDTESFASWLKRTGQTERAIKHFWAPVIIGALNDRFENCSLKYAGQVFHESFLKSSTGGRLGIPMLPLSEFYGEVARAAEEQGAEFVLRASVESISGDATTGFTLQTTAGVFQARQVIVALPFEQAVKLLPELTSTITRFVHAPITTVHLWWEKEITDLDHAVLLDTTIEWIFHKSRIRGYNPSRSSYTELVISASHAQLKQERDEIIQSAINELALFFPKARTTRLLKTGVLKEARATFSVLPGLDRYRPSQEESGRPGIFLAGDWTRTGWPSTMEGAVRSGLLAASSITERVNLEPDLPADGIMPWILGDF